MSLAPARIRREASAADELGPAARLAAALEPALAEAARGAAAGEVSPLSLAIDIAPAARSGSGERTLTVEAWVERATRTLVFAAAEARTGDGALAAAGSAVFAVRPAVPGPAAEA